MPFKAVLLSQIIETLYFCLPVYHDFIILSIQILFFIRKIYRYFLRLFDKLHESQIAVVKIPFPELFY